MLDLMDHVGAIHEFSRRHRPDWMDRDEAFQHVFAYCWGRRHHYNSERGAPTTWLGYEAQSALYKARRAHGAQKRSATVLSLEQLPRSLAAPTYFDRHAVMDLQRAVQRLSARERTVLFLRYWHGLTRRAVGKVLGLSQSQISRIEQAALKRLRRVLEVPAGE